MSKKIPGAGKLFWLGFLPLLLLAAATSAREGILVRSTELKQSPGYKSAPVTQLEQGAFVQIIARKGGWYQVKNKQFSGWLPLLSLRFPVRTQHHSSTELPALLSMSQGHSAITATTGVRGIGSADIKQAKPDFTALAELENFRVSAKDAQHFARAAKLVPQPVPLEEEKQ